MAQLWLEKTMTMIGTLRHNRKGIAKGMKYMTDRDENTTIVWHEKEKGKVAITSYVVKTKSL